MRRVFYENSNHRVCHVGTIVRKRTGRSGKAGPATGCNREIRRNGACSCRASAIEFARKGGRAPSTLYSQVASVVNLLSQNPYKQVRIKRIE